MPVAWAAAIGGAASLAGSAIQSGAQSNAASTQSNMFGTIQNMNSPYTNAGYGATGALTAGLGIADAGLPSWAQNNPSTSGIQNGQFTSLFNNQDLNSQLAPNYQFQLQQGQNAVVNGDTPSQGALSGSTLKDLIQYNQNFAGNAYQQALNNWTSQQNTIYGRLSGVAGLGQNSANQTGAAGTQLGTGIGQAQSAAGSSLGAGVSSAGQGAAGAGTLAYLMQNNPNFNGGMSGGQWAGQGNNYDNSNGAFTPIGG